MKVKRFDSSITKHNYTKEEGGNYYNENAGKT